MNEELIVSSPETGQRDNPELRARAASRKLKDKENKTLAEQLLLAQAEETIKYMFNGFEIEIYVPTANELDTFLRLFPKLTERAVSHMTPLFYHGC